MNGSGKTTLLNLIAGNLTPGNGSISIQKDGTIGMLMQEVSEVDDNLSVLAVAMKAFRHLLEMNKEMEALIRKIEDDPDDKKIELLSTLQTKFKLQGGYVMQSSAEEILEGIGFKTTDLNRPMSEFSGGWKMRVILARLLLEKPSILMLDEPTNHLDLPSIQWFESYIRNYDGAVIIVSHDKKFLDNTVNKIIEIEDLKFNTYHGNYSHYVEEKATRLEIRQNAHLNQQKKIREAEKFINRFRAKASKARQVQSRIKLMEKIELIENAKESTDSIDFEFRFSKASGKNVLEIHELSKRYGSQKIFDQASGNIQRGDKIALVGANGIGKTTLLKIIAGSEPFTGQCAAGYNVVESYYAQHQVDALNYKNTVLEELSGTESSYAESDLRNLLGSFLFSGDDVFKKIAILSGGEKARVALAKTLISNANFLILDEPTNHLDIHSVDVLTLALKKFQGSMIMVSHDRQFIDTTANKIWYIDNFRIKEYPGSFSEYIYWTNNIKINRQKEFARKNKAKQSISNNQQSYLEQKEFKKKYRSMKKDLEFLELEITLLEKKKEELTRKMSLPEYSSDFQKLDDLTKDMKTINSNLQRYHHDWENLYLSIEEMENL